LGTLEALYHPIAELWRNDDEGAGERELSHSAGRRSAGVQNSYLCGML